MGRWLVAGNSTSDLSDSRWYWNVIACWLGCLHSSWPWTRDATVYEDSTRWWWWWVSWYQNATIPDFIVWARILAVVMTTGAIRNKAPVISSPPTRQQPTFYRPDALHVTQSTVSEHWRARVSYAMDLVTPGSPGRLPSLSWPLKSPGYLVRVLPRLVSAVMPVPQLRIVTCKWAILQKPKV